MFFSTEVNIGSNTNVISSLNIPSPAFFSSTMRFRYKDEEEAGLQLLSSVIKLIIYIYSVCCHFKPQESLS